MDESRTYWAALDPDRLARRAMDKVTAFRRWFRASGHAEKALKGWRYSHGWTDAGENSSRLQAGGERGHLVKAVVNGVRPLRQRVVAMTLSGEPEMQPIAANSDSAAREQADLGRGVLEHIHRVHKRPQRDRQALSIAMDMSEAHLVIEWDARLGEPVAVEEDGETPALWAGDFRYWVASAFDVYRDTGLRDWDDKAWVIVRRWVSRFRLAALYPEKAERILGLPSGRGVAEQDDLFDMRMLFDSTDESDMVPEYVLWHLDSPELPGGREFRFLPDGTWLTDGEYPYEGADLPAIRLAPEDVSLTSLGYTNLFDALGLSDAINGLVSGMVTNTTKGAVPPLLNFKGSGVSLGTPLGTGHVVLDVLRPDLKPEFMAPPQTPPEAYKLVEVLERLRLEGMGLNETSMGRPPYSGMAAQAMALLDAKADEYQDGLRKGFLQYSEQAATFELRVIKRYAKEERVAQVAGKAKQWMAKAYTAESLSMVDAVRVEPVNQASRTLAGKFGLLDTFSNFGVPLKPEQIVELVQTGQFESDFEGPMANRLRVREENELLMEGKMPPVIMLRPHWEDILEHMVLMASPGIADKPNVVDAVMTTIQAKIDLWRSMPSDLLQLLGGPPPPPPPIPAGMLPPGGAPMGPEGMPGEPAPTDAAAGAVSALDPAAEAPTMPNQPPEMAA